MTFDALRYIGCDPRLVDAIVADAHDYGTTATIHRLQRLIDVPLDDIIGPVMLHRLAFLDQEKLFIRYMAMKGELPMR